MADVLQNAIPKTAGHLCVDMQKMSVGEKTERRKIAEGLDGWL